MTEPITQSLPNRLGKLRLAARSMRQSFHLPSTQLLGANLLHVANTDPEAPRQLCYRSLFLLISLKNPAP